MCPHYSKVMQSGYTHLCWPHNGLLEDIFNNKQCCTLQPNHACWIIRVCKCQPPPGEVGRVKLWISLPPNSIELAKSKGSSAPCYHATSAQAQRKGVTFLSCDRLILYWVKIVQLAHWSYQHMLSKHISNIFSHDNNNRKENFVCW